MSSNSVMSNKTSLSAEEETEELCDKDESWLLWRTSAASSSLSGIRLHTAVTFSHHLLGVLFSPHAIIWTLGGVLALLAAGKWVSWGATISLSCTVCWVTAGPVSHLGRYCNPSQRMTKRTFTHTLELRCIKQVLRYCDWCTGPVHHHHQPLGWHKKGAVGGLITHRIVCDVQKWWSIHQHRALTITSVIFLHCCFPGIRIHLSFISILKGAFTPTLLGPDILTFSVWSEPNVGMRTLPAHQVSLRSVKDDWNTSPRWSPAPTFLAWHSFLSLPHFRASLFCALKIVTCSP